jgi:MFS family permease
MAIFFSAATAAGAFGGLIARGIMELDGKRGIGAWSWIFIIEGSVTIVIGKCSLVLALFVFLCYALFFRKRVTQSPVLLALTHPVCSTRGILPHV